MYVRSRRRDDRCRHPRGFRAERSGGARAPASRAAAQSLVRGRTRSGLLRPGIIVVVSCRVRRRRVLAYTHTRTHARIRCAREKLVIGHPRLFSIPWALLDTHAECAASLPSPPALPSLRLSPLSLLPFLSLTNRRVGIREEREEERRRLAP